MPLPTSLGFMSQPFWRCLEMVSAARHIIGKHIGPKALKCITQRRGCNLKDERAGGPVREGEDVQLVHQGLNGTMIQTVYRDGFS